LTDSAQKTAAMSEYFNLIDFTKVFPETGVYGSILGGSPEAFFPDLQYNIRIPHTIRRCP
jgi:hypothetical protein